MMSVWMSFGDVGFTEQRLKEVMFESKVQRPRFPLRLPFKTGLSSG